MHCDPRRLRDLTASEALRRLGSAPMGRIVFTTRALPAIHPAHHRLAHGDVVLCCHEGAALLSAVGQVVAYEADVIDPQTHTGWCVVVTGKASMVEDQDAIARYERMLQPRGDQQMTHVIRIHPEMVTGYEFVGPVTGGVRQQPDTVSTMD